MSVDYIVSQDKWESEALDSFDKAAGLAIVRAMSNGQDVIIDALCYSQEDADSIGEGESYAEDPDASVTARLIIKAENIGRIA